MTKTIKGCIIGNIFDTLLVQTRNDFANQIRNLSNQTTKIDLYNPLDDQAITTNRYQTTEQDIYQIVNKHLDAADFIVLDLTDHNSSVLVELGRVSTLIEKINPNLKLYVWWRLELNNQDFCYAVNRYVRGVVEKHSAYYPTQDAILMQIKQDFNL